MKVQSVITLENKVRYILLDNNGEIVQPVLQYLKFKDNTNAARNTLRAYSYHLKLFFEFLEQRNINFLNITIDNMADFIHWLQTSSSNSNGNNIIFIYQNFAVRSPRTINTIINTVINFYDYLIRHETYSGNLPERLSKLIKSSFIKYKGFLHHINKNKNIKSNILHLKVPNQRPKTISKDKVELLLSHCQNSRDKFLIMLLWESGIRIGEALSLWLEDVEIDNRRINICDRGELTNLAEIKTICSTRTIDISLELIDLYLTYISKYHTDNVDTNHVFIKISGSNQNHPLEYSDVDSLFKRLRSKCDFYVTPHIIRHSSLTELKRYGWKDEHLMKRAGHASIQTTLQMYVHPSDDDIRNDWNKVQENIKLNLKDNDI